MPDATDPGYPDTARVLRLAEDQVERDACVLGAEIRRTGRKRNITLVAAEEASFGEKLDARRKALTAWSHAVPPHDWALAEESARAATLATALAHAAELTADGAPPATPFLDLGRDTVSDSIALPVLVAAPKEKESAEARKSSPRRPCDGLLFSCRRCSRDRLPARRSERPPTGPRCRSGA